MCVQEGCRRHLHQGEEKEETHHKSPSVHSENEQGASEENVGSSDIIQRQVRDLTATETRVQKEEGEKLLAENSSWMTITLTPCQAWGKQPLEKLHSRATTSSLLGIS